VLLLGCLVEGACRLKVFSTWTSPTMSGESTTGSMNLGSLRQCEGGLKAIEAAADVESIVVAMRANAGGAGVQEAACCALKSLIFNDAEYKTRV